MSLQDDLTAVLDVAEQPLARLPVLMDHIPAEWVEAAASLSSKASIRRRRLPPDMVLWLVIGMAFFRSEPIHEVARRLKISADGLANEDLLAKSALSHARQRLGQEPAEWLFKRCARAWGLERYPEDDWYGLQVFALTVRYCVHRILRSCASTSAQAIPRHHARRPIRCCVWSP